MKILLLSDIHANYPALEAVAEKFPPASFDSICNCGDSLVYGPYPNETLKWLQDNNVYSILGNTDRKVKKILKGKSFKKPGKEEKRIMYTWTAEQLTAQSIDYLLSLKKTCIIKKYSSTIHLFHGSPEHPNEFLFPFTDFNRFQQLSYSVPDSIVITGHSHCPYYKLVNKTHFINPGSVGRMFDSDPSASCAILNIRDKVISVEHFRIEYQIKKINNAIKKAGLPEIYERMYLLGQKLN